MEDPMFKKNPAKEEAWKEKLKSFERSGLSAAKWCEKHHEKIHTLKYWKLRLKTSSLLSDFEEIPRVEASNDPIKITCKTLSIELPATDQKTLVATLERLLQCCALDQLRSLFAT